MVYEICNSKPGVAPARIFWGGVVWPKATDQYRNPATEVPRSGAEGAAAEGLGGAAPHRGPGAEPLVGARGRSPRKILDF